MASIKSEGQIPTEKPEDKNLDIEILTEEYSSYDLSFKIIVIGNSGN